MKLLCRVQPKMESLQSPKRTCSCLGKAQPKMEEIQSNNKSSLLDLLLLRCGLSWILSILRFEDKVEACRAASRISFIGIYSSCVSCLLIINEKSGYLVKSKDPYARRVTKGTHAEKISETLYWKNVSLKYTF